MPHLQTKTVYLFSELSERAKERARDWFRTDYPDYDWWDSIYADAEECGRVLGIELAQKRVPLMGGNTRYDPSIWFSGFSSQGDGACFDGSYAYAKGAAAAIRVHAPQDKRLHAIADALQDAQRKAFYRLTASTRHSGHYYHSGCMSVDVERSDGCDCTEEVESDIRDALRSFADWIYAQLRSEYEYLLSDEQVDESITCNDYEFTESGVRA